MRINLLFYLNESCIVCTTDYRVNKKSVRIERKACFNFKTETRLVATLVHQLTGHQQILHISKIFL